MWHRRWFLRIGGMVGAAMLVPRSLAATPPALDSLRVERALGLLLRLRQDRGLPWDAMQIRGVLRSLWDEMNDQEREVFTHLPQGLRRTLDHVLCKTVEQWNAEQEAEWRAWLAESVARRELRECGLGGLTR